MKAILHIGLEKTGTTSIQHCLAGNRDRLAEQGICFPTAPGRVNHIGLIVAAMDDDRFDSTFRQRRGIETPEDVRRFREELSDQLREETSGFDTVVLSNEHCSSRLFARSEIERLKDLVGALCDDIRVVVYLRRQDEFLLSSYSTAVRGGNTAGLSLPGRSTIKNRYDYRQVLDRWQAVFGDTLAVRVYDAARLHRGDVVEDFFETAGIPLSDDFVRPARENTSLGAKQIEFLRRMNAYLPKKEGNRFSPYRGNLGRLMGLMPQLGGPVSLPPEELEGFMAGLADANAHVADRYIGERQASGDPLFGEIRYESLADGEETDLTLDDAFRIFAELWKLKAADGDDGQ